MINSMLTIGIPFYNSEKFLSKAIQSVLKQTYTNWTLILLDDGSTDNSLNIAKEFAEKDSRIKVLSDGQNKHLAYRLNEIAKLCQTKYLARMDADDIMHPERLEKQLKILEQNPEIDVLGSNAYSIDDNDNIQGIRMKIDNNEFKLLDCKSFIHPSIMAKTTWFRANPYDIKAVRVEDYELWQRTLSKSVFKVYTQPLLFYREFGDNYYKKYFSGFSSKKYVATKLKSKKLYLESYKHLAKGLLYYCLNLIGKENYLIQNRYVVLNEADKLKAINILNKSLN